MYASFNLNSASVRKQAAALVMQGVPASEAVRRIHAELQVAQAMKDAESAVKAEVFKLNVELGKEIKADAETIALVRREYEARQFARSTIRADYKARNVKLDVETLSSMLPRYSSRAAMIVARQWFKASWTVGACYARQETLDSIRSAL